MKTLAFDLGKVLFDYDYDIAMEKIKHKVSHPKERIIEDLFYNNFSIDFEKGLMSSFDFYSKFKKAYEANLDYDEFVSIWCDIFTPKPEIIDLAKRLSTHYPMYLISNINEAQFQHLYKDYPDVFSIFKELILSYKVKSIKPETGIYEELKKISASSYENIIYIDDRADLIQEAKKLKLNCIRFIDLKGLLERLQYFDVKVPS